MGMGRFPGVAGIIPTHAIFFEMMWAFSGFNSLCILWRMPQLLFFLSGRLYPCIQEMTRSQSRASIPSTITLGFWDKKYYLLLFSMLLQQDSCEVAICSYKTPTSLTFYFCFDSYLTSAPGLYNFPK